MHELLSTTAAPLPLPQLNITIRPATLDDIPFMDGLQKLHTKQVGWMPTKQFEGKINAGHVLIAEEGTGGRGQGEVNAGDWSSLSPAPFPLSPSPIGYCIGNDQYFKRDDVGIIYQMNVVPGKQRGLIGASLLKAQFERSAYGCKLYCCWCAQDIAANQFWEAMGFVPLAFRSGSAKKSRTHIFWQKRIRQGDATTPWWFPSQTSGGSIREDRLVLPIPPGTHWSDAKPMILPGMEQGPGSGDRVPEENQRALPSSSRKPKPETRTPIEKHPTIVYGGLRFGPSEPIASPKDKKKREPKPKAKNDPKLIAAARELRDRWLEAVNTGAVALPMAKYDVGRVIEFKPVDRIAIQPMKLLDAA